jgi:hypothetical protein
MCPQIAAEYEAYKEMMVAKTSRLHQQCETAKRRLKGEEGTYGWRLLRDASQGRAWSEQG